MSKRFFFASLIVSLFPAQSPRAAPTDGLPPPREAVETMANAIRAEVPCIVLGRLIPNLSPVTGGPANEWMWFDLKHSLDLYEFAVSRVIVGPSDLPRRLFFQFPHLWRISAHGWVPDLGDDQNSRLLFLVPGKKLNDAIRAKPLTHSPTQAILKKNLPIATPEEVFAQVGVEKVLNRASWFELFEGQGSVAVDLPALDEHGKLAPLPIYPGLDAERVAAARTLVGSRKLERGIVEDVQRLARDWPSLKDRPTTEEPPKLESETGRAVWRELQKKKK